MFFSLVITSLLFLHCQKEDYPDPAPILPFEVTPVTVPVNPGIIDEASGIADSKLNTGFLWVEQDSGNPPDLFLLSYNGSIRKKIHLNGAVNRDWEDITTGSGPLPGENYVYVAETGDNNAAYSNYSIYRFIEPALTADTVYNWEKITFQYPDGAHDAEAILLDNETRDIYIITKRESKSKIYKLPYPQNTTSTIMAIAVGELSFGGAVSAALSPDEKEILVKTYTNVYYWKRKTGETLDITLQRTPVTLGYDLEPQGEAICFKNDNAGFFTLSEKPFFAASVGLNFYKRK